TAAIQAAGWRVEILGPGDDFEAGLKRADALVIIDPGISYADHEIDRIETFVATGGRLLLVGEPAQARLQSLGFFQAIVPQTPFLDPVASRFGISFSESHLFNMERNAGNYLHIYGDAASASPLVRGVDRTTMYTATTVHAVNATPLLRASEGTRRDRTDTAGEYPLAVVTGNVVAVGDATWLLRGNYQVTDNDVFLENIVGFLTSADRHRTLRDYPGFVAANPTIRYTSPELLEAAQTLGADIDDARPGQVTITLANGGVNHDQTDVLVATFDDLERLGIDTGIDVSFGVVSVPGYESSPSGVFIIHRPAGGIDLVVAADSPDRAADAVDVLTEPNRLAEKAISNTTAVGRSDEPVDDLEPDGPGNATIGLGASES
ncbi:MAG: hypothetical protein R3324_14145, partial [Halobacteriales archaeon]|nr:hypothetical protein [Halobacteriales archaeon]